MDYGRVLDQANRAGNGVGSATGGAIGFFGGGFNEIIRQTQRNPRRTK